MLCFRCEHRAKFHEAGHAPRHECSLINSAVSGCYMFKPVKPIVIKHRKGDDRFLSLNIFSCRVERVNDVKVELELQGEQINDSVIFYWVPKKNEI